MSEQGYDHFGDGLRDGLPNGLRDDYDETSRTLPREPSEIDTHERVTWTGREQPSDGPNPLLTHAISSVHRLNKNAGWIRSLSLKLLKMTDATPRTLEIAESIRGFATESSCAATEFLTLINNSKSNQQNNNFRSAVSEERPLGDVMSRVVERNGEACRLGDLQIVMSRSSRALIVDEGLVDVVSHLVENALEAGAAPREIRVEASRKNDEVVICVEDGGPGMPPEMVRKCTAPGVSGSSQDPARGVGLSVVREIVETRGGRLAIHSNVGIGTAVLLRVPQAGSRS